MSKKHEPYALFKSICALVLIVLCLWAAQWQFQRGVDRHSRNNAIESNSLKQIVPLASVVNQPENHEWQPVTTTGIFNGKQQILLRNRYFEGVYGFEVLTLFTSSDQKTFWVDRGWVKAVVIQVPVQSLRLASRHLPCVLSSKSV